MDVLPQVRERMDNMTAMENKPCDACPHLDECEVFAVSEINGYEAECPARTKERVLLEELDWLYKGIQDLYTYPAVCHNPEVIAAVDKLLEE